MHQADIGGVVQTLARLQQTRFGEQLFGALVADASTAFYGISIVGSLVVPQRPAGTEGWSEDDLAGLVTRDSMIGTGVALEPEAA